LDRSGRGPEALEEHRLVTQYLRKNAYRMDYPAYQQRGWQIGSGSMESGCKTVICQRLCGGGMRWGTDGADSVSHLRALFRSEPSQWEAFWNQSLN
ncbi:MAG TPA: ISKra4 family transposase, partial [Isosphaeraceae bacterium]|nr:ISKra4 family transposase [Isosphaeraceae bacterium]